MASFQAEAPEERMRMRPRRSLIRALEFACAGSRDAVACATPRPLTWPTPDHTVTDPSRYLFVAQVRGYWPSLAELYGVREDTTLFIPRRAAAC